MVNTGGIARGPLCYNSPVGVASLSQQKAAPYGASGSFLLLRYHPHIGLIHLVALAAPCRKRRYDEPISAQDLAK